MSIAIHDFVHNSCMQSIPIEAQRADQLLAERNMSLAELARRVGTTRQTMHSWIREGRAPSDRLAWLKIADALSVSLEYLQGKTAIRDREAPVLRPVPDRSFELRRPQIPVGYPYVQIKFAGIVPTAGEWGDPLESTEFVEIDARYEHPKRFAATVSGNSCFPALQQGDLTIWHADHAPAPGLIILAEQAEEHGCTVKQMKVDEAGQPFLIAINPNAVAPPLKHGWLAIARLVGVVWQQEDGTEGQAYRPSGLRPEALLRMRQ